MNSLTLSRIIQLNTGIRNISSNVFFSTQICKDVVKHECVVRKETTTAEEKLKIEIQRNEELSIKLEAARRLSNDFDEKSIMQTIICISLGVIILLLICAFGLIMLWRKRNQGKSLQTLRKYCFCPNFELKGMGIEFDRVHHRLNTHYKVKCKPVICPN